MTEVLPTPLDPDVHASASHRNLAHHLTSPLRTGATESEVMVSPKGTVDIDYVTREPLLLAAPRRPLDGVAWELTVHRPDGTTVVLNFATGTEAEAHLPLYRPPVDAETGTAQGFTVRLTLVEVFAAERRPVPAEELVGRVSVRLVQGITGRVLYLLGAEKARLRRQARELARVRTLDGAYGDALDRIGADLGVPRFFDTIHYREPTPEQLPSIFGRFRFHDRRFGPGRPGELVAEARREPDGEYRRRLAIYRPWLYPTRRHIETMLNGPGAAKDPNRGLLAGVGVTARARVTDAAPPVAAAVYIVAAGERHETQTQVFAMRANFLEYIRGTTLVWPGDDAESQAVHTGRFLPDSVIARTDALRQRLRKAYSLPARAAIAPRLAEALDRLARCCRALGVTAAPKVSRCQDIAGGSRYELGLGVDVESPRASDLSTLVEHATKRQWKLPKEPTGAEPDPAATAALLAATVPRPPTDDPHGAWLMEACGLPTVVSLSSRRVYVSHIPTFGLTISGPQAVADRSDNIFEATVDPGVVAQFRWHAVWLWRGPRQPLREQEIEYVGERTHFRPRHSGVYAIVALGLVQTPNHNAGPYEFTVDMPAGTVLNLLQYEYLMNLLAHVHPMGTRVSTWSIRQHHVDITGDGTVEAVPSHISRTYRQYRRPRFRGATASGPVS